MSRVDPDSLLATDLATLKEREGKDHILLSFMFKVYLNTSKSDKFKTCVLDEILLQHLNPGKQEWG